MYKETTSNRIGRLLLKFNQHKVYTTQTNGTYIYCDLWKTRRLWSSGLRRVLLPMWIWWTDRQTTNVRYKDHTKKHYSSHTNLMMAEHSTNAKFYTHFKVAMTHQQTTRITCWKKPAIESTEETSFKQFHVTNQPCSKVLLEKQILPQLVQKIPHLMEPDGSPL
jgi:hypothetical protein